MSENRKPFQRTRKTRPLSCAFLRRLKQQSAGRRCRAVAVVSAERRRIACLGDAALAPRGASPVRSAASDKLSLSLAISLARRRAARPPLSILMCIVRAERRAHADNEPRLSNSSNRFEPTRFAGIRSQRDRREEVESLLDYYCSSPSASDRPPDGLRLPPVRFSK